MASEIVISPRALSKVDSLTSFIHSGVIYLFQGPRSTLHIAMEELIDRLAIRGQVTLIAGGNWVAFDRLPILLKERQGRVYEILDHIHVSRAETCYQMADVLTALKPSPIPLIITDILNSFEDEDLLDSEVNRLIEKCAARIKLLSQTSPVLVSATSTSRPYLIEKLEELTDMHIRLEPFTKANDLQMSLGF